jgi:hypothetical protein
MDDLTAVFDSLAEIFAVDGCPRAEVRLTMSFLDARRERMPEVASTFAIDDPDVAVWSWCAADPSALDARWWHVTLPLFDERGAPMGSFLIWQQPETIDSPLPHFHAIAGELRRQVENRLVSLWPVGEPILGSAADFFQGQGTERATSARRRGRDRVPSGSGPAIPAA